MCCTNESPCRNNWPTLARSDLKMLLAFFWSRQPTSTWTEGLPHMATFGTLFAPTIKTGQWEIPYKWRLMRKTIFQWYVSLPNKPMIDSRLHKYVLWIDAEVREHAYSHGLDGWGSHKLFKLWPKPMLGWLLKSTYMAGTWNPLPSWILSGCKLSPTRRTNGCRGHLQWFLVIWRCPIHGELYP